MSIPIWRRWSRRLAALGALAAAFAVCASPAAAATIPAGGMAVEHASLDWSGNQLLQGESEPHVGVNFFSAGVSDGTEATYSAQLGNVSIYNVSASGAETPATWATRGEHTSAGSKQIVRLTEGVGRIEADGSAKIDWAGSFSVNFYAGLVPFTITDPELVVGADGAGRLTGTIVGCEASMGGSGCSPLAPAQVTVATFSGAHVDPEEALTIDPDYAGVEVETVGAPIPQNRTVEGWGSWPQSFVDYQIETGLSSYWYSSGHEDAQKAPLPFIVDFKGPKPTPPATTPTETTTTPVLVTTPAPVPPRFAALKGVQKFGADGVAKLVTLSCPSGGGACTTTVPKRIGAKIGGKRYVLGVMTPKRIAAGKSATVRVHLPKAAQEALSAKPFLVKLKVALHANGLTTKRTVKVKIAGRH